MPEADQNRSRKGIVGFIAFVASAFIGFNTLVTSCASENMARKATQLHTIEEKERFWTEAMQELSGLVRDKGKTDDSNYEARCRLLARRTAPFVVDTSNKDENPDDPMSREVQKLADRADQLAGEFEKLMLDPVIVGAACADEFVSHQPSDETETGAAEGTGGNEGTKGAGDKKPEKATTATEIADGYRIPGDGKEIARLISLAPPSDTGYDVDIFWCELDADLDAGSNSVTDTDTNFANALALGQLLAGYATQDRRITNSEDGLRYPVGRIRVRVLTEYVSRNVAGYRRIAGANRIHGDGDEASFIDAVIAAWNAEFKLPKEKADPKDLARNSRNSPNTRWYVSAFMCAGKEKDDPAPAGPRTRR